jgi:hypothetical protein
MLGLGRLIFKGLKPASLIEILPTIKVGRDAELFQGLAHRQMRLFPAHAAHIRLPQTI